VLETDQPWKPLDSLLTSLAFATAAQCNLEAGLKSKQQQSNIIIIIVILIIIIIIIIIKIIIIIIIIIIIKFIIIRIMYFECRSGRSHLRTRGRR
jgi:Flp pilus assembly protein TadB